MADDGFKIEIPEPLGERIKAAAAESGLSTDDFVSRTLEAALDDVAEDLRRLEEPGEDIDADVVFDRLDAMLKARRST
jgi:hypothetical protein